MDIMCINYIDTWVECEEKNYVQELEKEMKQNHKRMFSGHSDMPSKIGMEYL